MEDREHGPILTDEQDERDLAPIDEELGANPPEPSAEELNHHLFTKKYTKVTGGNFTFGAYHTFTVDHAQEDDGAERREHLAVVHFQEGPIKENGVNGVCNEDLLLMVLTRLNQLNSGPFSCRENSLAITKLEEAVMWLRARTLEREMRKVEGTNQI